MSDRKVILYIAMSLDGYIADTSDDIGFLSVVEQAGEDYGYEEFTSTVDTVIMGRKTYDKVLSFGIEFPHKDKTCYVLSKSRTGEDENVRFYHGSVEELIAMIRATEGKHIYCDGGAETVFELLKYKLIDKLIISVIPYLVGSGVRLFKDGLPTQELKFIKCIHYPSGLVQLCYDRCNY